MDKRIKLAFVILCGLLLVGIGLYFIASPILEERRATSPLNLPGEIRPSVARTSQPGGAVGKTAPAPAKLEPASPETVARELLQYHARALVERIGSGSNRDGFRGYRDAMLDATKDGRVVLQREQAELQKKHPATGSAFGISTRAVSSQIVEGEFGNARLVMLVQAIQREDAGEPSAPIRAQAKEVRMTYVKQSDETYLIEVLEWKDVGL